MTKAEQIVTALLAGGCIEVSSKSRKYRQFTRPSKPGYFYFVGKAGALRTGMVSSSSASLAIQGDSVAIAQQYAAIDLRGAAK